MSLTKSQVRQWVEAVEMKALNSIQEDYINNLNKEKDRILEDTGIKNVICKIDAIASELNDSREELHSLITNNNDNVSYYDSGYGSLSRVFDVIGNFDKSFKEKARIDSNKTQRLAKDYEEKRRLVKANYESVKAEVMKHTPAKSIEYLKQLGFDTSTLVEKEPKQEIAAVVDTRYLFVCGDNK